MIVTKKNIYDDDGNRLGLFKFTYPDYVVFAFNPLFLEIEIESSTIKSANFKVIGQNENGDSTSKSIDVNFYKGKTRIFYSRILQLFFYDVMHKRSIGVSIYLYSNETLLFSTNHCVIWGGIALGERFNSYGTFAYDAGKPMLERTRIWFKNFPFTVSLFFDGSLTEYPILSKFDNKPYDENAINNYPSFNTILDSNDLISSGYNILDNKGDDLELLAIVFCVQTKCFLGIAEDIPEGKAYLYKNWVSDIAYFSSSYYNENGVARTDMTWICTTDAYRYRFDNTTNTLTKIPYGMYGTKGLNEIDPNYTFPEAKRTATYKQIGPKGSKTFSVFDKTFDHTFFRPSELAIVTHLIINNNKEGYYLRWIDKFGLFQYYLFTKGQETTKNKLSSEETEIGTAIGGNYFSNHNRFTSVSSTITCKCCATCLKDYIYDYVSTIITSPIIDLYLGKTKSGEEIWLPVNIVASNHKFLSNEKLHDLEISFTKPIIDSQTL